jgi:cobalt-zinc-cadmium efflux system membrane fusion protein
MNAQRQMVVTWPGLVAGSVVLLALGAAVGYVALRPGNQAELQGPATSRAATTAQARAGGASAAGDILVPVSAELIERAGIVVDKVRAGTTGTTRRLPGVVEPNAYKTVTVTTLVNGRVTRVLAEVGQRVERGAPLAELYSPELSEAETGYVTVRAELEAHERELQRTEKLVDLGAASRQELERLHAEHTAKLAEIESARAKVALLGVNQETIGTLGPGRPIEATAVVTAPLAGTITARMANAGLNVDPGVALFTVTDLSTVWVVADVYERDVALIREGSRATVTVNKVQADGVVSFIDPRLDPQTRTAKMRIELRNPKGELRLGMFADVQVTADASTPTPLVPKAAIQRVDNRTVVYLADQDKPGQFIEREVHVGEASGDDVPVVEGLRPGDSIVTTGSFAVRAERERLGLRPDAGTSAP